MASADALVDDVDNERTLFQIFASVTAWAALASTRQSTTSAAAAAKTLRFATCLDRLDRGMNFDPTSLDLKRLFRDPDMFDSSDDWRSAGFKLIRASEEHIVVAKHKSADGYLFKKYMNKISLREQLEKLTLRFEGARKLSAIIKERRLQHIIVPHKYLHELPARFSSHNTPSYVLIVERLSILDKKTSEHKHRRIDEDALRELCLVFFKCRGLDFTAKNAPFTKKGKIAFIDTQYLDYQEPSEKQKYLKYANKYLSGDRLRLAEKLWTRLGGKD